MAKQAFRRTITADAASIDSPCVSGVVVMADDSGGVRDAPGRRGGRSSITDQIGATLAEKRGVGRERLYSRLDEFASRAPLFTSDELALAVLDPPRRARSHQLLPRRADVPEKSTIVSVDLNHPVGRLLAACHDVTQVIADVKERLHLPPSPTSKALARLTPKPHRPGPGKASATPVVSWRAKRLYNALVVRGTLPSGCFDGPVGFGQQELQPITRPMVEKLLTELIDAGLLEARVHLLSLDRPDWRSISFPEGRPPRKL